MPLKSAEDSENNSASAGKVEDLPSTDMCTEQEAAALAHILDEPRPLSWWMRLLKFSKRAAAFCTKIFGMPRKMLKKLAARVLRNRS
jgi:hypothetical protein